MNRTAKQKLIIRLVILGLLSLGVWAVSGKNSRTQAPEKDIHVITRQLENVNGVVPVDIRCDTAHLSAPNQLDPFDCRIRNNTEKRISAATAVYSILLERNGTLTKETHYSSFDTIVHPNFDNANKRVGPAQESIVGPPGPISYPEGIIRGIEINIDYVEFDDNTTLGANEKGAEVIRSIRTGAARYKEWLDQKFKENGKSFAAIVPLLQRDQPLPNDVGPFNSDEEIGARAYRDSLRKLHQTRGTAEAQKLLE